MKKLILFLTLFLILFCGQESKAQKQQFVKDYSIAIFINSKGEKSEWYKLESRIFFNYSNDSSKIKVFISNKVFNYSQIAETIENKTENGEIFYELHILDNLSGEELYLQVFKNEIYGVRSIGLDRAVMQLANPVD